MTNNSEHDQLDLAAVRERLAQTKGKLFWRSLDEVAETPTFKRYLEREFPRAASEWNDPASRRSFLKLMGASLALAGLTGCTANPYSIQYANGKLVPYVKTPENLIPGKPQFYATSMPFRGYALGVLAESHEGRPTKIEGNGLHPASLGATDIFAQASVLTLYDPDRSAAPLKAGAKSDWPTFVAEARAQGGAGLRILSEVVTSPTLQAQVAALLTKFAGAKWYQYEPVNRSNIYAGTQLAFGTPAEPQYRLAEARVILSLDGDFLGSMVGNVRYARDFSDARRVNEEKKEMVRLYVAESTPSITGAMADHRLAVQAGQVESIARAFARALGVQVAAEADTAIATASEAWIAAAVKDLQAAGNGAVVIVGDQQPAAVHAIAAAMNNTLGAVGNTLVYTTPIEGNTADQLTGLRELVADMNSGAATSLLILGGNPAYTAPADIGFAEALAKVPFSAHLSLYADETSDATTWHINEAHFLEGWSDARAFDGTASIVQPLINPLYGGKTAHEVIEALAGGERSSLAIVQEYWQGEFGGTFDNDWQVALHDGLVQNSALPPTTVTLNSAAVAAAPAGGAPAGAFELIFRPDPSLWDGRFANNGWLQELPKPYTKLTWDNAALMSTATAEGLGAANGDLVQIKVGERSAQLPVWMVPGHPEKSVTVYFGHGRTRAGRVGSNTGFNVFPLQSSDAPFFANAEVTKASGTYELVSTQLHHNIDGREIIKLATLEEFAADPEFMHHGEGEGHVENNMRNEDAWVYNGNKWGMSIDTNVCIGCNACVVACQSENNSPVVGKAEVARGREMQWLRIDEYYEGSVENPRIVYQPMACQQCEQAPCEVVCPVAATVHDAEGINNMVYNRCVGTKYCSNNCPYKVRRYNFLQYNDIETPVIKLLRNPEVTVRNRGVMEKCNYCIQRINGARIESKKANRPIADGEVVTACQGACPTRAIVFGNLNDPASEIAKFDKHPLKFTVLGEELNTRPRTSYLARLVNGNAEIGTES